MTGLQGDLMTGSRNQQPRLAVLIDGDNASSAIIAPLLGRVSNLGRAVVRRVYGDWTAPRLGGWKSVLLEHSLQPIQQFAYTQGKNATDSALIIDAMDLLHTADVDGFCIVSSDSDFTRLASRLRESGKIVHGFGERSTPTAFVAACDAFIAFDELRAAAVRVRPAAAATRLAPSAAVAPAAQPATTPVKKRPPVPIDLLKAAISGAADDDGWVHLGKLGSTMKTLRPSFTPKQHGFAQLHLLLKAQPTLELKKGAGAAVYVRVRRTGKTGPTHN